MWGQHPTHLGRLECPTCLCGLLYLRRVSIMSELRLWSLRLLFVWQLLWLLVQAAPIRRVALDSSLLTSVSPRPTEPWLSEQQVPPPNIYDDSESSLYVSEASAPTMEFPGQMESSATKEDISTKTPREMVVPPSQPGIPAEDPEVTGPHPEPVQAPQQTYDTAFPPLNLDLTITPNLTGEDHATAVTPPTAPPKHPKVTFPHPEPIQALQQTLSGITVPPLDLELTITPEAAEEELPTAAMPPTAPSKHPKVTFPYAEPVQPQQATLPEVTVPHLDLELTMTPKPAIEAELPIALKLPTTPPEHPKVTFPHPEPVQAQQPHISGITFPPLDLELTITPEATVEEQATAVTLPTIPPMHPEVTFPHPEPVQPQQATLPGGTVPSLDLELTITPKPTVEEHPTSVTPPSALPTHPEVTFPYPEPVQYQQPTFSDITVPPLDLELTITPKPTVEEHPTSVTPPSALPTHPEVTFPYPEPIQYQQPTSSDIIVPPLDLELTITPKPAVEAELPVALHPNTAPPRQPEMTFPQAQEPALPEVTAPHLDLELTITPELTVGLKHPVALQPPTAATAAQLPTVMFPHPESTRAQQPTLSDVTSPPLNLELTVTPEPSVETEHPTAPQLSTAPPKYPEVTVLVRVQQLTQGEVQVSDVGLFRTQQPETSEAGPPITERKLPMDICKLCTCYNRTMSCTGLSPEQKLRSVPVLYPNVYNHTFTIVNLQGNSISHIDKNTWKSYHLVEKLILSDNNLKELHKDSFEGLLSLQYLDLSSNKILRIERNTFDSVPFLQHLNLQNNLMTTVSFGTFQAWHGMQFLHHLTLNHNPLKTVEDPYLFKLRKLQYLDMGTTEVSLTTVERILMTTLKLEKLILPSHLVCCLCQFKKNIEAVSKTVKFNCDSDCLRNTHCDEELRLGRTEGSFMKILQGREENNCPELTIEPEGASSGESGDGFTALTNILKELLSEQEALKVSKVDWDTEGWKKGNPEAQVEEDGQGSRELIQEVPGYGYKSKLTLAAPVIAVTSFFTVLFLLIVICHKQPSEECKEEGDLFSSLGYESSLEEGGSWSRRPLFFWERHWPFNTMCTRSEEQYLYPKDDDLVFSHMGKGAASMSTARVATLPSAGEKGLRK